ncbi:MAG: nucleotide sugar dehydrogenase [Patescibacteria group bacterium]|nr:nucleotide sugar dehydrogenase [Patescibacteria group bacterium]
MRKVASVVGIGRVGLPLALFLADQGYMVYGIGRDKEKLALLKQGKMPFIEEGAHLLKKYVNSTFSPTHKYNVIKKSHVIILTLGTPIDENMNPVLDQINTAMDNMFPFLKKGQLIILRSTVSPSTTTYVKERIAMETKLTIGKDIFLAFCPERIAEGKSITETKEIPQIIGGIDAASTKKAKEFFESCGISCLVTDATSAELAKLFTNMYRYISFAIANEFMVLSENFDRNIHEIVDLVNTGYKRNGLALPGLTAGPCLFKDGFFLVNDNPFLDLITASWKINEAMPLFLIKKLKERTALVYKKVTLLGLAFKPEIDDTRESLSFKIRKALLREHAVVTLHDPFVKHYQYQKVSHDLVKSVTGADIVIIATRHNEYAEQKDIILKHIKPKTLICDIWNVYGVNKLIFRKEDINNK